MKKRGLSLLLTLALLLGLCSPAGGLVPSAQAAGSTYGVLTYTIDTDQKTVTITGCAEDASGSVVVPAMIEGYPVTRIGKSAFKDYDRITSVVLPEGLERIEADAFYGTGVFNRDLEINIPTTVRSIGTTAFADTSIQDIVIPEGVTYIEDYTFFNCHSLRSITIPRNVLAIGPWAFSGCSKLCDVYYEGTEAEWDQIAIGAYNSGLTAATLHFASSGEPEEVTLPTPTLQGVENKTDGICLTWNADFYLPGIGMSTLGYQVLRKTDGGSWKTIATLPDLSTGSYTDTDVEMGKTYTYTVRLFVGDRLGDYDSTGKTITRLAVVTYTDVYPNTDLGWPVVNNYVGFGLEEGYHTPRERYYEVLGTTVWEKFKTELRHIPAWGGACYGMSLLAAAQYNGQISLGSYFSQTTGDDLADFGFTGTTFYGGKRYVAQMTDETVFQLIERAQLLQYSEVLQTARLYLDEDSCIEALVNYVRTDNSKPLLLGMSSLDFGHAVLTYPKVDPVDLGDGRYAVMLYDPNTPQVGDNILSTYLAEGTLHRFYTAGISYLVLDTKKNSWAYYNAYKDDWESADYWPQKTLEVYDVSKLPSSVFKQTVERAGSFLMVSQEQLDNAATVSVILGKDGVPVLTVTKGKVDYDSSLVKGYTWPTDRSDTLFVWLEDDCDAITIQGDGFVGLYCDGDTLYNASVQGKAAVSFGDGQATASADERGTAFVAIQRDAKTKTGGPAVSSETTLAAGEDFTLELSKDGTPSLDGPDGQKYDMVLEKNGTTTEKNNVTEDGLTTPTVGPFSFTDVTAKDWFYEAVKYAYENELMSGTSTTAFTPNGTMSRAMLATGLYRMEGEPEVSYSVSIHGGEGEVVDPDPYIGDFTDVKPDMWYSDAIMWANQQGIVSGYSEDTFGTNDPVTREQLVTMLFRYAQTKTNSFIFQDYSNYKDANQVSPWASKAMRWAMGHDIISGTSRTTLSPQNTATRAQCATILMRFLEQ